jgi:hypothetical protein
MARGAILQRGDHLRRARLMAGVRRGSPDQPGRSRRGGCPSALRGPGWFPAGPRGRDPCARGGRWSRGFGRRAATLARGGFGDGRRQGPVPAPRTAATGSRWCSPPLESLGLDRRCASPTAVDDAVLHSRPASGDGLGRLMARVSSPPSPDGWTSTPRSVRSARSAGPPCTRARRSPRSAAEGGAGATVNGVGTITARFAIAVDGWRPSTPFRNAEAGYPAGHRLRQYVTGVTGPAAHTQYMVRARRCPPTCGRSRCVGAL